MCKKLEEIEIIQFVSKLSIFLKLYISKPNGSLHLKKLKQWNREYSFLCEKRNFIIYQTWF